MYSDSLGAAAGCAPDRSSLAGGVPGVGNAGFVGRVIQLAVVLRVTVLIRVKIKKKKTTQLSTLILNHTHDTAPQRDSSTYHTPLHHSASSRRW